MADTTSAMTSGDQSLGTFGQLFARATKKEEKAALFTPVHTVWFRVNMASDIGGFETLLVLQPRNVQKTEADEVQPQLNAIAHGRPDLAVMERLRKGAKDTGEQVANAGNMQDYADISTAPVYEELRAAGFKLTDASYGSRPITPRDPSKKPFTVYNFTFVFSLQGKEIALSDDQKVVAERLLRGTYGAIGVFVNPPWEPTPMTINCNFRRGRKVQPKSELHFVPAVETFCDWTAEIRPVADRPAA